jgi:hypothetical protein
MDMFFLALIVGFAALSLSLIHLCDKLGGS